MQLYGIVLEGKKLNPSNLTKDYTIHILGFAFPIYSEHWTHVVKLRFRQLERIGTSIPSLKERWSNMLSYKIISMVDI